MNWRDQVHADYGVDFARPGGTYCCSAWRSPGTIRSREEYVHCCRRLLWQRWDEDSLAATDWRLISVGFDRVPPKEWMGLAKTNRRGGPPRRLENWVAYWEATQVRPHIVGSEYNDYPNHAIEAWFGGIPAEAYPQGYAHLFQGRERKTTPRRLRAVVALYRHLERGGGDPLFQFRCLSMRNIRRMLRMRPAFLRWAEVQESAGPPPGWGESGPDQAVSRQDWGRLGSLAKEWQGIEHSVWQALRRPAEDWEVSAPGLLTQDLIQEIGHLLDDALIWDPDASRADVIRIHSLLPDLRREKDLRGLARLAEEAHRLEDSVRPPEDSQAWSWRQVTARALSARERAQVEEQDHRRCRQRRLQRWSPCEAEILLRASLPVVRTRGEVPRTSRDQPEWLVIPSPSRARALLLAQAAAFRRMTGEGAQALAREAGLRAVQPLGVDPRPEGSRAAALELEDPPSPPAREVPRNSALGRRVQCLELGIQPPPAAQRPRRPLNRALELDPPGGPEEIKALRATWTAEAAKEAARQEGRRVPPRKRRKRAFSRVELLELPEEPDPRAVAEEAAWEHRHQQVRARAARRPPRAQRATIPSLSGRDLSFFEELRR